MTAILVDGLRHGAKPGLHAGKRHVGFPAAHGRAFYRGWLQRPDTGCGCY